MSLGFPLQEQLSSPHSSLFPRPVLYTSHIAEPIKAKKVERLKGVKRNFQRPQCSWTKRRWKGVAHMTVLVTSNRDFRIFSVFSIRSGFCKILVKRKFSITVEQSQKQC
ncbi:Hypothetical_protein [Hexamita inflata]|uniref:Hypothetical_protein n=1 Tax=Hexamita inflata TaxID=28002 RepID=A0AA86U562_9EUKA|nr:Hypothetical protein HINF_LOCUS25997 [Hexamita inflata]